MLLALTVLSTQAPLGAAAHSAGLAGVQVAGTTTRSAPPEPVQPVAGPERVTPTPGASSSPSSSGQADGSDAGAPVGARSVGADPSEDAVGARSTVDAAAADAEAAFADTVTFDDLPTGTVVTDAYRDRGILFGSPRSAAAPFITGDGANPTSPVLSGSPIFAGDISAVFVVPGTGAVTRVDGLSLDVGFIDSPGSVQVLVFTAEGVEILSANDLGINTITATVEDIYAFQVVQSADEPAGFAIDNVSFTAGENVVPGLAGGGLDDEELNGNGNPASWLVVCGVRLCADPVNTATGNLTETYEDVSTTQLGPGLSMQRTYNSLSVDETGWFGPGWSSTWDARVDVDGDEATVRFGNGSVARYFRTPVGWFGAPRVLAAFDVLPDGRRTVTLRQGVTMTFDRTGDLERVEDRNGRFTQLTAPSPDTVVATDETGREVVLSLEGERVRSVVDPAGSRTTYDYDPSGRLTRVTQPLGQVTDFAYDEDHRLVRITDALGVSVVNEYDDRGRVVRQSGPGEQAVTGFTYDEASTSITMPDGSVSRHVFVDGLLVSATEGVGSALESTWEYSYDPYTGGRTAEQRPDGETLTREYDFRGNVVRSTDPEGRTHAYTYDAMGNRTSTTFPSGRVDSAAYDRAGNLERLTEDAFGEALTTVLQRSSDGSLVGSVSPGGAVSAFVTDAAGLPVEVTDPDGRRLSIGYDELGRETRRTIEADPASPSAEGSRTFTTSYDRQSRVIAQTDARGSVTTATYDAVGRLSTSTAPGAARLRYTYDARGNVVSAQLGDAVTSSTYDPLGRLLSRVDPAGGTVRYEYDVLGRVVAEVDALDRRTTHTYDTAGRLATSTRPSGVTATSSYDRSGLLTSVDYSDDTPDVSLGYDEDGRRAVMTDGTGTTRYVYDTAGRLTLVERSGGGTVGYGLDADDNVVRIDYPNGSSVERAYSPAGRLLSVTDWLGNTTDLTTDAFGQLAGVEYANGVSSRWSYDAGGEPTSVRYDVGGAPLASYGTETDPTGLVAAETWTQPVSSARTFGYDERRMLSSVDGAEVAYDFGANMTVQPDGSTQVFDLAGQLSARVPGAAPAQPLDGPEGAGPAVRDSVTAVSSGPAPVVALRGLEVRQGDAVVLLVSRGTGEELERGSAARRAPTLSLGGRPVALESRGTGSTSAGEVEVWSARAPQDATASVALRLGAHEGTTLAAAVSIAGVAQDEVVVDQGVDSQASLGVPSTRGDLLLTAVAAVAGDPAPPTPVGPGVALAAEVDLDTGFSGLITVTEAAGTQVLDVGMQQTAEDWVVGAVRLRPTNPPAPPQDTFTYTVDGARATHERAGTTLRSYSYDAENRLVGLEEEGSRATAVYDGDGLRSTWTTGAGTQTFAYDQSGDLPLVLTDGESSYVYADNGLPLSEITGDQVRHLLTDTRASVRAVTDSAGGLVGTRTFGVTGAVEATTGESSALGFQGQYTDDSGLQYLRARYYDPETAAFLTPDPLAAVTGSRYGFAGGNPVSFGDPTGLVFVSCAELIGGGATGLDLAAGISQGLRQRASNLGRALRTSPSPAVRSYAASQLRSAGQLANNPALRVLRTVGRGLPLVGAGITYGTHVLDGDSQAEAIGGGAGALAGGLGGAALGGLACGALAGGTFGLGAATCPLLIGGGGVVGGLVGDAIGSRIGGWIGRQGWF